ncbi:hypothetical protein ACHAXR_009993 [Thalassiosira sp. AJA248-18]
MNLWKNMAEMTMSATEVAERDDTKTSGSRNPLTLNRDFASSFLVVAVGCACLYLIIQDEYIVSPQSVANVAILWVASIGSGYACQAVGVPPLLGSLIAGILLQNIVDDFGISPRFGEVVETVGLCIILLISSTEIDINAVAKAGGISLRLTFLPGLVEAFTCAAASYWIFSMPPAFALSLGFILAAVSPAVVVPGCTHLQKLGFGVDKGIPSLLMAACALDDIVAISGFTIAIGIAMDNHDNLALSAFMHGPVAIFIGVVSGCISGVILAATRYCPSDWQRTAIAIELGLLMTYGYKRAGFESGAVATLMMGTIARLVWQQKPVIEYTQCSGAEFLNKVGLDVNVIWDIAVRPLLFGSIGAAFDLSVMPKESVFKSCAIVIIGLFIRLPTAFMSAYGKDLSNTERLFVAFAWSPKATVQAALCSLPLTMIKKNYSGSDNIDELVDFGTQIKSTSILAIIITAPIGLLSLAFLGPMLLSKESQKETNPAAANEAMSCTRRLTSSRH